MNVIDRCRSLRDALAADQERELAHKNAEAFRNRREELAGLRGRLVLAGALLRVLRGNAVSLPRPVDATTSRQSLARYRLKVRENPEESGREHGAFKRSLESVAEKAEEQVRVALASLEGELPTLNEAFLRQVELIPRYRNVVAQIRLERTRLIGEAKIRDMNAEQLKEFLARREVVRRLADDLSPDDFPKAVLIFFRSARDRGGAPYPTLTAEVLQWLAQHDLVKNLRVTVVDSP